VLGLKQTLSAKGQRWVAGLERESRRVTASGKVWFSEGGSELKQALGSELGSLWASASGYSIGRNQIKENPLEEAKPRY
jgi:hypothetical protein